MKVKAVLFRKDGFARREIAPSVTNKAFSPLKIAAGAREGGLYNPSNEIYPKAIMPTSNINDTLVNAQKIIDTWTANPTFNLGVRVTLEGLTQSRDTLLSLDESIERQRTDLQGQINQRNDLLKEVRQQITRACSGFRAVFGPDSSQYDQAGATRSSERKSRSKSAKTTKAA
ncbi:MAG: hypothetical protein QM760_21290 [Nibricoccus sp.]